MSTPVANTTPLGMTEAYHTTQKWLTFVGEPTTRIEDPTDGVLQLYTDRRMVRIRVGPDPAGQGAVIAMVRAAAEIDDLDVAMFSPTGYNPSAREFAEMRGIALFTLTPLGDVIGETVAARALMPEGEFVPAFSERALTLEPVVDDDSGDDVGDDGEPAAQWVTCPRCGVGQHPDLATCAACGTALDATDGGEPIEVAAGAVHGAPEAEILYRLTCNSCGSHDIDVARS